MGLSGSATGTVLLAALEPLGLSVTEAARVLGVTRRALAKVVNEQSGVSPEMAIQLSKAFGSSPEMWLGLQMDYDLSQMRLKARKIEVQKFAPAA